jgi:hypothetical protein
MHHSGETCRGKANPYPVVIASHPVRAKRGRMTGSAEEIQTFLAETVGLLPPTRKSASADSCPAKLAQRA